MRRYLQFSGVRKPSTPRRASILGRSEGSTFRKSGVSEAAKKFFNGIGNKRTNNRSGLVKLEATNGKDHFTTSNDDASSGSSRHEQTFIFARASSFVPI